MFVFSAHGYPDNLKTYGLVSGLWTSTFALGAFIGPFISGLLYDYVGFRKGVIFIIASQLLVAIITGTFMCYERKKAPPPKLYKELDAQEPLIPNNKHTPFSNGNYGGTDTITHSICSANQITISPQLKDRKYFCNDTTPTHQTNPAILSIA